ncbi:MAG: GspH/FimT family pseudopilin [Pseudomonadota bacterium]
MPILVAGRTRRARFANRQRGLTLVELLVVLLIVGMTAGLAAMSIPRGQSDVRQASALLERELAALRDQAVTEVAVLGLSSDGGTLTSFRGVDGAWVLTGELPMPGRAEVELVLDEGWQLPEHTDELILGISAEAEEGTQEAFRPQIIFSPEGSVTPFALRVREGRDRQMIRVGPFGTIMVDGDG